MRIAPISHLHPHLAAKAVAVATAAIFQAWDGPLRHVLGLEFCRKTAFSSPAVLLASARM